ncbi:MAG: NUDIX domain-containing protein [Anaerohalosphaeraceae bacterium]
MQTKHGSDKSPFSFCPRCGRQALVPHEVKAYRCTGCGFEFYLNVAAAVAGFILDTEGRLLVTVRGQDPGKDTLDLPGGFIDPHENAENAIRREIKEELNLDVTETKYLFSSPNQYPYMDVTYHTMDLGFLCKVDDFGGLKTADEIAAYQFIHPSQVKAELFGFPSIRQMICLFQDGSGYRQSRNR